MFYTSKLEQKRQDGKLLIGSHVGFDSPFITEMIAGQGFDFIWIDAEHSAIDKKDIQTHLLACRAAGAAGIVRVPWNDHVFIKSVLDMGADGIVVPMIRNYDEAVTAISATHYPPYGARGMGIRRACDYGMRNRADYVANSDKYIWTILQLEHIDVMEDLERIVALEGVSGFVVGPNDFCMSMNTPDRTYSPADPEVAALFDRIGEVVHKSGKALGVSGLYSEQFVQDWTRRGADFIAMNFDFHYVVNGAKQVLADTHTVCDKVHRAY